MKKQTNPFDDIIHLPRPELKNHKRAPRESRAAQFGAFRALTGHEEAVAETARVTDDMPAVSEQMMEMMNQKIRILQEKLHENPEVTITYYKPDEKKTGGAQVSLTGHVKKIDDYERRLVMDGGAAIPIGTITALEGEIFR